MKGMSLIKVNLTLGEKDLKQKIHGDGIAVTGSEHKQEEASAGKVSVSPQVFVQMPQSNQDKGSIRNSESLVIMPQRWGLIVFFLQNLPLRTGIPFSRCNALKGWVRFADEMPLQLVRVQTAGHLGLADHKAKRRADPLRRSQTKKREQIVKKKEGELQPPKHLETLKLS
ncbi:hypothetical protein U1Q18_040920 [Sarracenia purpurea var. burkii]